MADLCIHPKIIDAMKKILGPNVQSKMEGNILNENQDMIIPEKWQNKIIQTKLSPGQCTIHDGNSFSIHIQNATFCLPRLNIFQLLSSSLYKSSTKL